MPNVPIVKVASPVLIDATLPAEPNLRAVADDVLAKLRYSLAAAAAEEQPAASSSLDQLFRGFIATRSAPTRALARERSRALLGAATPLRRMHFGRYAAVSLKDYSALGSDGMEGRVGKLEVDSVVLKKSIDGIRARLSSVPPEFAKFKKRTRKDTGTGETVKKVKVRTEDPDLTAGMAFKKMRLYIREVRCIEETDEIGADHINMGGAIVGATGNTVSVAEFKVSDDFDQGERRDFGFNKVFGTWMIRTGSSGFPYVYTAVIAMAEKDDNGFYKFLKEIWAKIGDMVQNAIGGLVGGALGAALGSIAGPIGTVIGAVFGALISWFIELFDNPDDIVGVKTLQMSLGACTKSYYDWAKLTTAQGLTDTVRFRGDGGRYDVDLSWKVAAQ